MSKATITPCTQADIPQLQEIAIRSYNNHYLHLWHDNGDWYVQKSFSTDQLTAEISNPNTAFFLIHNEQQELVGFLKLNISQPLEGFAPEDCLELERIYLLKRASGKGIGNELIDFTMEFAKERGKKVVWLKSMDSSHQAIRFYIQNGFEMCGECRLDFAAMKEEFRGMFILKRELQEV